ncbi:hypothetical protein MIZ01_0910 [Sideroxyarcus emersonii]|uniref:Uncharacterized protein n=1 Tax=Sideroxyarcus emersonii TaxID=2764705 RepID=A0AAN1X9E0_9PROT|nr:hypothetical protein MIZ01_0910 [Sideroxyarcus emersonii]
MKPVWLGIVFFIIYGLFSMKSRAAESVPVKGAVCGMNGVCWSVPGQGR